MSSLKVNQVRSAIGSRANQRETLRSLGLGKIGSTASHQDKPEIRGMIAKVTHLVTVEEVE
jgi:large subunit ribosomal protein L30